MYFSKSSKWEITKDSNFHNCDESKETFDEEMHSYPYQFDEAKSRFLVYRKTNTFMYVDKEGDTLIITVKREYRDKSIVSVFKTDINDVRPFKIQLWINALADFVSNYPGYQFINKFVKDERSYDVEMFEYLLKDDNVDNLLVARRDSFNFQDNRWTYGKEHKEIVGNIFNNVWHFTMLDYTRDIEECDYDDDIELSFSALICVSKDRPIWKWLKRMYELAIETEDRVYYKDYIIFYEQFMNLARYYNLQKGDNYVW